MGLKLLELARIYVDQEGVGEATALAHGDYKPGCGVMELAAALMVAEEKVAGLDRDAAVQIVAAHLETVLIPKGPR